MKGVWLTWENQRRNKGLSAALDWPLYEITSKDPRLMRYIKSIWRTVAVLHREKPSVVVAQNPSMILATLSVMFKRVFGYRSVIDAHNTGIYPLEGRSRCLMGYARLLQRLADITIVTNSELAQHVQKNGGRPFILPDRIPNVPKFRPISLEGRINIAFICTFREDEPYLSVIRAARQLPKDFLLHVTGNFRGKISPEEVPSNVRLLGFIPEENYWGLLGASDIVVDLTLREGCLVCGAYEGLALSKPLVLSDTKALKEYFHQGCIYTGPEEDSIAEAILEAASRKEELERGVRNLKEELQGSWSRKLDQFKLALQYRDDEVHSKVLAPDRKGPSV